MHLEGGRADAQALSSFTQAYSKLTTNVCHLQPLAWQTWAALRPALPCLSMHNQIYEQTSCAAQPHTHTQTHIHWHIPVTKCVIFVQRLLPWH